MDFNINTKRLVLRPPVLEDSERLFQLMSDSSITQFLSWEAHTSIETTENLLKSLIDAQKNDKGYHWCICFENVIIGLVSLIDVRRKIRTWILNRAELSYWISTQYQGKGFATEASKAATDFGFSKLELHKIIVAHAAENIESEKICAKLKFKQYAYEHDAFQKDNKWNDLIWYELMKQK